MTCFTKNDNGTEILLDYCSATASPKVVTAVEAHAQACQQCRDLIAAQRGVFESLDQWQAPEVSANFDQRLYARIAEQRPQPFWTAWFNGISLWKPALAGGLACAALALVLLMPGPHEVPRTDASKRIEHVDMDQVEQALEDLDLLAPQPAAGPM